MLFIAFSKPNMSSFIGAGKNRNFAQNHINPQRPRFASSSRAFPETNQNFPQRLINKSTSPIPSSAPILSITSSHSEAISIETSENFNSKSFTKYIQIGNIVLTKLPSSDSSQQSVLIGKSFKFYT